MYKHLSKPLLISVITCITLLELPGSCDDGSLTKLVRQQAMRRQQLAPYMITTQTGLEQEYQPKAQSEVLITRLNARLNQSGQILKLDITKHSGSERYDQSVVDFIRSHHFAALPSGVNETDLHISFTSDRSKTNIEVFGENEPELPTATRLLAPYMAEVQTRIQRAWFPPKGHERKRVVVIFKISRDGKMSNLRLDHSCGIAIADMQALKAAENASPFPPLPSQAPDSLDIQFTFDSITGCHGAFRTR